MSSPSLAVRPITAEQHRAFVAARRSASFLQTPAWAEVKPEWGHESLGWFTAGTTAEEDTLVGVGLVLYRQLPAVKRYLAYLPEGPVIDWESDDLASWLGPMSEHLKAQGAFGVRMGPPVVCRRWDAQAIKDGIADGAVDRLTQVPPTAREPTGASVVSQLHDLGWRPLGSEGGFSAGQPQYNFWVPLRDADGQPLDEDAVLAGMNQQWRRNIKKAAKEGVVVERGSLEPGSGDLTAFHEQYVETAQRDGFTPRGLAYFEAMARALGAEDPDRIRLYLARHEGELAAATIWVGVGGHAWYSYGASSTAKRDVRASNAVQWQMIRDSLALGADVYDLRGITVTLDEDDAHVGLIRFKVGTGGDAVEYAGEWDLPLRTVLYKVFDVYMRKRG